MGDVHRGTRGSRPRNAVIAATYILVPERPRDDDRREYDKADRVDPGILRGLVLAPLGKAARLKLLLTVSSCYFGCRVLLRRTCIIMTESRYSVSYSLPLGFTKRSRPVALFMAHQHETKPGLEL